MGIHVFYLDDEIDICEAFCELFSSKNVLITTFTNYKVMLEELKKMTPTLIFLDYRLPLITGDDVAQLIDPSIPKFLMTADFSVCSKYKFSKILSKPFNNKEIISILDAYATGLVS